jgi:hypothetical protein
LTGGTGAPTNLPKKISNINKLQRPKTRSSSGINGPQQVVQIEVMAGRIWRLTVSADGV